MPIAPTSRGLQAYLDLPNAQQLPLAEFAPPARLLTATAATGRVSTVQASLGPASARLPLHQADALLPLLDAVQDGKTAAWEGQVLLADFNLKLQRSLAWTGGVITELALDPLDAQTPRQTLSLGLQWQADRLVDKPASGSLRLPTKPGKGLLASNFRVQGLPFDASGVVQVELPVLRVQPPAGRARTGSVQLSELQLLLRGRSLEPARKWAAELHDQVQAQPGATSPKGLDLSVELLDPSLRNVMARITLQGARLSRCAEGLGTGADEPASLELGFVVERLACTLSPAAPAKQAAKRAAKKAAKTTANTTAQTARNAARKAQADKS